MKILLGCCLLLLSGLCSSQSVININEMDNGLGQKAFFAINGEAYVNVKFVSLVEGSPYFTDEWMLGRVRTRDGQMYAGAPVKYDLVGNELHYLDPKGKEYISSMPLLEVFMTDTASGRSYHLIHSSAIRAPGTHTGWYQVLVSGQAWLLKSLVKKVSEIKPYSSATTEMHISNIEQYLVLYNNALMQIKKLREAPGVLANKRSELENFLDKNDNKGLSLDNRFAALISFYNKSLEEK